MAKKKSSGSQLVDVPVLEQGCAILRLIGDSPMLVNNKASVAWAIAKRYQGSGQTKQVKAESRSPEEEYLGAFYTLPSSPEPPPSKKGLYGIPASGIKKCLQKGIRPAGFTDNTTVGLITKSFRICDDEGGLCLLRHNGFTMDARPVSIPQKTTPQIRYRPIFPEWELHVRILFNAKILSPTQLANLAMHAGQYIGLCELRAEKMQGECGGFVLGESISKVPAWATDKRWNVTATTDKGFRILAKGQASKR